MDNCSLKVSSWLATHNIGIDVPVNSPFKDALLNLLLKDTLFACKHYGAYTVRKAAIQRMAAIKQMEDSGFLSDVTLAAYNSKYDDLIYISNVAFDRMTDEERHIEFCLDRNIQPCLSLFSR